MLHFVLVIFSRIDLYSNGSYVPKALIAGTDINGCYLEAALL
jgi:hypothetical protein